MAHVFTFKNKELGFNSLCECRPFLPVTDIVIYVFKKWNFSIFLLFGRGQNLRYSTRINYEISILIRPVVFDLKYSP